jgi:CRISPR-associated protein Cas5d
MENRVEFKVTGRFALFTDPLTKIGGEKCSYHIPTYEALKGIAKSIYWKPTFIWVIDKTRIMKRIQTQSKSMKPINYSGVYPSMKDPKKKKEEPFHTLSIYTYLADVEYQVQAHFEWNPHRGDLAADRNDGKHFECAKRMIEKGGRQDIFLGTRECQGYVEPCVFGEGSGDYDQGDEITYGLMFHGFDYPDEIGEHKLYSRFWIPTMKNGEVVFPRPDEFPSPDRRMVRKFVRTMIPSPPKAKMNEDCEGVALS